MVENRNSARCVRISDQLKIERSCPSGNAPISDLQDFPDGRDGGAAMDEPNRVREGATPSEVVQARETQRAGELENRIQEMVDYRDAGELSDAELEEQKAKLRWN